MTAPAELPADRNAEDATVGSCLMDREVIIAVMPIVDVDDFYYEVPKIIHRAQRACADRREPVDLTTVAAELKRRGELEQVGGLAALIGLCNAVPTAVHAEYYARTIKSMALRRRLIAAGASITRQAYDTSTSDDEALAEAEAAIAEVAGAQLDTGAVTLAAVASVFYERLARLQDTGATLGLATGFHDLDGLTGGLQRSDLLLLAARPGTGKTSLALNLGYNVARAGGHVAVYSLEMSREQLLQRILATETGLDMQKLRTGQIRDSELTLLAEALGKLSELPFHIDDCASMSIQQLRSRARRLHAEQPLDLVIVDYLQLLTSATKSRDGNRVQEISEISRGLKALARELDVPVLALSQLSRAVEGRSSKVPLLSDLRESGSLEQDADIVMFIYREELYDPDTDKKGVAELHLAKHRNGPTGIVPLRFFRSTTRFATLETYRQVEGY